MIMPKGKTYQMIMPKGKTVFKNVLLHLEWKRRYVTSSIKSAVFFSEQCKCVKVCNQILSYPVPLPRLQKVPASPKAPECTLHY